MIYFSPLVVYSMVFVAFAMMIYVLAYYWRHERGADKWFWFALIILIPLIGPFAYIIKATTPKFDK